MNTRLLYPEAMIFDVDGTLFQTETLLLPAYHATFDRLREEGLFEGETPPESAILNGIGMLLEDIWKRIMPQAGKAAYERANVLLLEYQLQGLSAGEGKLYDGVAETLKELAGRGIKLFTASNGLEGYVKGIVRHMGLETFFVPGGLFNAGEYATATKVDLVKRLLDTHRISSAWMVGDRSSDVEAGSANGLPVIGCDYAGFRKEGELNGASAVITRFEQLLELLDAADKE